jgi:hypothetical protein
VRCRALRRCSFVEFDDVENAEEFSDMVVALRERLAAAKATSELINAREALFGFPVSVQCRP